VCFAVNFCDECANVSINEDDEDGFNDDCEREFCCPMCKEKILEEEKEEKKEEKKDDECDDCCKNHKVDEECWNECMKCDKKCVGEDNWRFCPGCSYCFCLECDKQNNDLDDPGTCKECVKEEMLKEEEKEDDDDLITECDRCGEKRKDEDEDDVEGDNWFCNKCLEFVFEEREW
jgi:hypothetical protein